MNVLVLNLTRFGDLIQTQPVISGLAARGDQVTLVCLDNFSTAAGLLADVNQVVPFAGARLLSLLDRDWRLAVAELDVLRQAACKATMPDAVVNLTPSLPARLLARVFGAAKIIGFGVDEFGFNADTSAWAAFLQTSSANRGASPFNVVDLFCRSAGLGQGPYVFRLKGPGNAVAERMKDSIYGELLQDVSPAGLVGIQLGASEERRRWPVSHFVSAARMFWQETGRAAVLFGTKAEKHLGKRFEAEADFPFVNLVGRTGLDELAAALLGVDLLITNDTGTMHLAAGLGVPVAAIFLATAQPFDTGPYAENCLCFEPDMECHPCAFGSTCPNDEACRKAVTPETLFNHARTLLDETAGPCQPRSAGRVWQTRVGDDGLMQLDCLSDHASSDRSGWISLQRFHYRRFLDNEEQALFAQPLTLSQEFVQPLSKTLSEARDVLFLLEQQATLLSMSNALAVKNKFLANWQKLQGIFEKNLALDVLSTLWMFQSQSEADDLAALTGLIRHYHRLCEAFLASLAQRHES